jgi:hypothetical protein
MTYTMYQMAITCNKCLSNIPNGYKIYQHFPFPRPSKIYPNWDFGLEIYHLATLVHRCSQKLKGFLGA